MVLLLFDSFNSYSNQFYSIRSFNENRFLRIALVEHCISLQIPAILLLFTHFFHCDPFAVRVCFVYTSEQLTFCRILPAMSSVLSLFGALLLGLRPYPWFKWFLVSIRNINQCIDHLSLSLAFFFFVHFHHFGLPVTNHNDSNFRSVSW